MTQTTTELSPTALERGRNRLDTQIGLLDWAAATLEREAATRPGIVVELGLGNGRTYDHLRVRMPERRIVVLDREMKANPARRPAASDFIGGEIDVTWRALAEQVPSGAALIHADLGDGTDAYDHKLEAWLGEACAALAAPSAIIISSTRIAHRAIEPLAPPFQPVHGHYRVYVRR